MGTEDTVEPVRHWHPDLCSAQLLEGLCIQDQQESTLVLQEEEKGRVSVQAELLCTVFAHKGTKTQTSGALRPTDCTWETNTEQNSYTACAWP